MSLNTKSVKECLKSFDFKKLFIEELGWDRHSQNHSILIKENTFYLYSIAQKRGVQIFICNPKNDGYIPEYNIRKKIEKQVRKIAHEHLIIFLNDNKTRQIWQWVKRQPGKAAAYREYSFEKDQSFERLIQKLDTISFTIDEEEGLTLPGVTVRLKDALDRDRVTKQFYENFAKKNEKFLSFIQGITYDRDKEWYSSVMLNRLMFIYFIQKKGFLDNDRNYLRNHLEIMKNEHGTDQFYSFYRYFLLRLFHEGLGKSSRTPELDELLGNIPYLNGGLFQEHLIEKKYDSIKIPDKAFEELFNFFDQYEWYLDDRPLSQGNEINPDVLGYIFEKFINQKEMGAYYTKEDITKYISSNTIIPFIFDSVKSDCNIAFDWKKTIWDLLKEDPDRYIYRSVKKGISIKLPEEISKGIDDCSIRDKWNEKAIEDYALPAESWYETIDRREHYQKIRKKLESGEIHSINDFITYNLDLIQFTQDVIENSEGPELIRSFYKAISDITICDPAVGSGAFLFAALNILEPLYEACLNRMQIFVEEIENKETKFQDFFTIIKKVEEHPNRQYFIFKSIILNNLYGIDIMDEAVEICKLRLFLKLVSVVNNINNIEALPDIDFNIRAGNTLVGFTSKEELEEAITAGQSKQKKFILEEEENTLKKIENLAEQTDEEYCKFRILQNETKINEEGIAKTKKALSEKLKQLENELNVYLATRYKIFNINSDDYQNWIESHKPFHWFVDFYGIMKNGGFDIIIGNPPYIRTSKVQENYTTIGYYSDSCPDVYAWMLERVSQLLNNSGRSGMILPLSLGFGGGFHNIRELIFKEYSKNWFSSFGRIPSALFSHDVRVRNTIHIGLKSNGEQEQYSTRLHRWFEEQRPYLFPCITYSKFNPDLWDLKIPKLNSQDFTDSFEKCLQNFSKTVEEYISNRDTNSVLNFKKTAYNWLSFSKDIPPCFDSNGNKIKQTQFDLINIYNKEFRDPLFMLLNGKLVYIFWIVIGDDFHVAKWMFSSFPMDFSIMENNDVEMIKDLSIELEKRLQDTISYKVNAGRKVGNYNLARSRDITDKSDKIFSKLLGLDEVFEFINLYYYQVVKKDFE
jgi:hypothetical protein